MDQQTRAATTTFGRGLSSATNPSHASVACQTCSKGKTRCIRDPGEATCRRCKSTETECVMRTSKRKSKDHATLSFAVEAQPASAYAGGGEYGQKGGYVRNSQEAPQVSVKRIAHPEWGTRSGKRGLDESDTGVSSPPGKRNAASYGQASPDGTSSHNNEWQLPSNILWWPQDPARQASEQNTAPDAWVYGALPGSEPAQFTSPTHLNPADLSGDLYFDYQQYGNAPTATSDEVDTEAPSTEYRVEDR